jgi:hypothetical protein
MEIYTTIEVEGKVQVLLRRGCKLSSTTIEKYSTVELEEKDQFPLRRGVLPWKERERINTTGPRTKFYL